MTLPPGFDRLREETARLGLDLTDDQFEALAGYHRALYEKNQVMNLTRVREDEAWVRHYLDGLLFHDLIPNGAFVVDLGTGPGLPAWPLALARTDLHVTAVDSNGKMLGFLRSQPLPNLEVVQVRAEEWGVRDRFDVATGRAVAPLSAQLELSAAPVVVGGLVIPMRTPADDANGVRLSGLGLRLREVVQRDLPGTDIVRAFPIYEKERVTDPRYPRRWAEMKTKPL
ncbi:MAG: 16S rRNA (guanine(527)-N(7))-methyltransferase RsmG [Fimbriimonas sp.]